MTIAARTKLGASAVDFPPTVTHQGRFRSDGLDATISRD